MKAIYLIVSAVLLFLNVQAQERDVFEKGNKVFLESSSKNENAIKTNDELLGYLQEWGYWTVAENKTESDFTLITDVTASKGMTAVSWGGTSYSLIAKLVDENGEVLWESNAYKSSPNGTNGFNSSRAVVKKLMKDLKKKFK
ncbi:hypothetical protein [Albibacterium indicum]|uniref:hypothetical protein n=1 Tax=Albibacterium indicum TaxID=2292082 RepID=UPI000E538FBD|nr:hypothetical protein [Pedobacter indicus]